MSDHSLHTVLRALSSRSHDGIICCDPTGRPLWWNAAAPRFFFTVTPEASATARRVDDLLCVDAPARLQQLLTEHQGRLSTILETRDGELSAEISVFTIDPTPALPAPIKLLIVQPAAVQCADWPSDTFRLFGTLLHRIKNAFAAVKLLAQGAQIEMTVAPRSGGASMKMMESFFQRIDKEVDRAVDALDTVKHLLVATGPVANPVPLASIVRATVREQTPRLATAGVTVGVTAQGAPGEANVDPDAIRQIVSNLLYRAARSASRTGAATHLEVRIEQRETQVALVFRDDGPAVPLDVVARLERHQFSSSQEELPLMVVHWIADRYRGNVIYSSPTDPGCTVEVRLPRAASRRPTRPRRRGTHSDGSTR